MRLYIFCGEKTAKPKAFYLEINLAVFFTSEEIKKSQKYFFFSKMQKFGSEDP